MPTKWVFFTFCEIIDLPHFGGGDPQNWAYDLKFKLGQDFCIMHLLSSFRQPMFDRSEVILFTNKQTNEHTNPQTKRFCRKHPPRSAAMQCRWRKILIFTLIKALWFLLCFITTRLHDQSQYRNTHCQGCTVAECWSCHCTGAEHWLPTVLLHFAYLYHTPIINNTVFHSIYSENVQNH